MKTVGVIAEYDPFHNGHAHQLAQLRRMGFERIVVALGTVCAQRGGFYLMDEPVRVQAALDAGADLVISLPPPYSGAGAEAFGAAGVCLLTAAGCDTLAFGAETPDAQALMELAALLEGPELNRLLREGLDKGESYAAARQKAVEVLRPGWGLLLESPNNILGVEYCKAICRQNSPMRPLALPREGTVHGQAEVKGGFASASLLRARFQEQGAEGWQGLVPGSALELYRHACQEGDFLDRQAESLALMARLRGLGPEELAGVRGLSEGLEHRLAACLRRACSLGELCALMYTRRYPAPRLRRLATDAALGYGPDLPALPPYLHVLGGQREALSLLKNAPLPAGTSLARLAKADPGSAAVARTTAAAFDLRALCRKRPGPMGEAYTRKPVFPQEK